eukprot:360675-Chlamydomonas_euryale.AAC.9
MSSLIDKAYADADAEDAAAGPCGASGGSCMRKELVSIRAPHLKSPPQTQPLPPPQPQSATRTTTTATPPTLHTHGSRPESKPPPPQPQHNHNLPARLLPQVQPRKQGCIIRP